MDKQQSEHIENRFRQAAENFLPPSNSGAWEKMEALLDKKSDKKRVFIWWWPLGLLSLMLAGSAGLYYYVSNRPAKEVAIVSIHNNIGKTGNEKSEKEQHHPVATSASEKMLLNRKKNDVQLQKSFDSGYGSITIVQSGRPVLAGKDKRSSVGKATGQQWQSQQHTGHYAAVHNQTRKDTASLPVEKNGAGDIPMEYEQETDIPLSVHPLPLIQAGMYVAGISLTDSAFKNLNTPLPLNDSIQQAVQAIIKKEKEEQQNAKPSKFYILAAAGRNATNLHKFDTKNIGTVYGGEIGYHLNHVWSIQAGLYVGRKIYFAGPSDYKFEGAYWRTVTVLKVDANCLIFDIPLSARFDIMHNKKNALYAKAGVSSFIMNREDYKYHFNTSSGTYGKSEMKYKGNVDLFSSVNLSVGYEQKLFKTLFIQAEPYAKLPISGVGAGKIKLYSLGIQLGLKYQPLKRK